MIFPTLRAYFNVFVAPAGDVTDDRGGHDVKFAVVSHIEFDEGFDADDIKNQLFQLLFDIGRAFNLTVTDEGDVIGVRHANFTNLYGK